MEKVMRAVWARRDMEFDEWSTAFEFGQEKQLVERVIALPDEPESDLLEGMP
jgi:hypothetical protein